MNKKNKLVAVVIVFAFLTSGCDKLQNLLESEKSQLAAKQNAPNEGARQEATEPPIVARIDFQFNTESPDQAVKTWWRYLDFVQAKNFESCQNDVETTPQHMPEVDKIAQNAVLNMYARKNDCMFETMSREIQEVKMETSTRSVLLALIKNTTPVPNGAVPDKYDTKWRDEGFKFKYLLEKNSDSWKVSQVYRYDEYSKEVWVKEYPESNKIHYPSYVRYQ